MSLSNNSINHFLYLAAVILLLSCAAVMAPPGGPKDITPPELIETSPPDGSINYAGNQIVLEFSEYIKGIFSYPRGESKRTITS